MPKHFGEKQPSLTNFFLKWSLTLKTKSCYSSTYWSQKLVFIITMQSSMSRIPPVISDTTWIPLATKYIYPKTYQAKLFSNHAALEYCSGHIVLEHCYSWVWLEQCCSNGFSLFKQSMARTPFWQMQHRTVYFL